MRVSNLIVVAAAIPRGQHQSSQHGLPGPHAPDERLLSYILAPWMLGKVAERSTAREFGVGSLIWPRAGLGVHVPR